MKVLAMYLPQFHHVKENDEWWGEGFTEWTAVRSAEKLFNVHEQPRLPFNKNYYDLMDPKCMRWQAELLHKYEIDGMCFYHYFFKDGKKILEKPAENLLKWQDIDMPYCFSWANESWVRSWSNLSKSNNPWFAKFDEQTLATEENDGILLRQDYGDECAWEQHYRYLSSFFHDKRYIKYEEMPVFMFYKPDDIPCLNAMVSLWDKLAQAEGFPGIYTIGTTTSKKIEGLKGVTLHEPQDTFSRFYSNRVDNNYNVMRIVDYQDVWNKLIFKQTLDGESLGCFVGYDDTPRRGNEGTVVNNRNPQVFYEGMKRILTKAKRKRSPFVFINAWNEWGEGMYLEPDEKYGFDFLEAFCRAKHDYLHIENLNETYFENELSVMHMEIKEIKQKNDRYMGYWQTFDSWMKLLERGGALSDYIKCHDYKHIAIYGYGMLGKHLVNQLNKEGCKIDYAIEKKKIGKDYGITIYSIADPLPRVDLIIVTVLYDYNEIYEELKKKTDCDIIPLDKLFLYDD